MSKYSIIILLFIINIPHSTTTYIRICNHGGYLAKCYLESQSFIYELPTRKYDTGLFPVLECPRIDMSFNSVWNRLECKALVFIGVYKTIFTHESSLELLNSCYKLTGTILNPSWVHVHCN